MSEILYLSFKMDNYAVVTISCKLCALVNGSCLKTTFYWWLLVWKTWAGLNWFICIAHRHYKEQVKAMLIRLILFFCLRLPAALLLFKILLIFFLFEMSTNSAVLAFKSLYWVTVIWTKWVFCVHQMGKITHWITLSPWEPEGDSLSDPVSAETVHILLSLGDMHPFINKTTLCCWNGLRFDLLSMSYISRILTVVSFL